MLALQPDYMDKYVRTAINALVEDFSLSVHSVHKLSGSHGHAWFTLIRWINSYKFVLNALSWLHYFACICYLRLRMLFRKSVSFLQRRFGSYFPLSLLQLVLVTLIRSIGHSCVHQCLVRITAFWPLENSKAKSKAKSCTE